jgi:hypothetical protein
MEAPIPHGRSAGLWSAVPVDRAATNGQYGWVVNRFRDTVTINVPLPADEAMLLFTARGERSWVQGWDPQFPAGEPSEEGDGTVFVTTADGRSTYWIVAASATRSVRYARTTPGFLAGTVEVRERRSDARSTLVDVTYDLSALTADGAAELDDFAAGYEKEISSWEVAIENALADDSPPR